MSELAHQPLFLVHMNIERHAYLLHAMQMKSSVLALLLRPEYGSRRTLEHTGTGILQQLLMYRVAHGKKQLVKRALEAQIMDEDAAGFCQNCSFSKVDLQSVCVDCVYCERSVGTVFQLPSPDAIYSQDEGKERK
jgi:hypothetical protein